MDSVAVQISAPETTQELLIAELSGYDVCGFEQDDHHLVIYFRQDGLSDEICSRLRRILRRHGLSGEWDERVIPERDWNSDWERSFQPISVPPFYVRSSWAKPDSREEKSIELIIDPQMSFGTGHHESTRLALHHLGACGEKLAYVLDVGTGSGILAIAAAKMGAQSVLGIDIDPWALRNASENVVLNQVAELVEIREGTYESVEERGFSLILANINRTVLTRDLVSYIHLAESGAVVILSGLQLADKSIITELLEENDCPPIDERTEADWWSVRALCPSS